MTGGEQIGRGPDWEQTAPRNALPLCEQQPDFGLAHIKSHNELRPGMYVEAVPSERPEGVRGGMVVGVGLAFNANEGFVEAEGQWVFYDPTAENYVSGALADDGLAPYAGTGLWHPTHYVRQT